MRLIDADKLLEETRRDRDYARKNGFMDMYYERQTLIDRIEVQPTAYDVDKVVEQLEELGQKMSESKSIQKYGKSSPANHRYYKAVSVKRAIEIVKGGEND